MLGILQLSTLQIFLLDKLISFGRFTKLSLSFILILLIKLVFKLKHLASFMPNSNLDNRSLLTILNMPLRFKSTNWCVFFDNSSISIVVKNTSENKSTVSLFLSLLIIKSLNDSRYFRPHPKKFVRMISASLEHSCTCFSPSNLVLA